MAKMGVTPQSAKRMKEDTIVRIQLPLALSTPSPLRTPPPRGSSATKTARDNASRLAPEFAARIPELVPLFFDRSLAFCKRVLARVAGLGLPRKKVSVIARKVLIKYLAPVFVRLNEDPAALESLFPGPAPASPPPTETVNDLRGLVFRFYKSVPELQTQYAFLSSDEVPSLHLFTVIRHMCRTA